MVGQWWGKYISNYVAMPCDLQSWMDSQYQSRKLRPYQANISVMAWIRVSATARWSALNCKDPAATVTSFLYSIITAVPTIILSTSPKSIDLKSRFKSNSINLLNVKVLRDFVDCTSSEQSFLMKFEKALRIRQLPRG